MAAKNPQQLNWRTSIVDLMKLLDLDSSLTARKQLADELHYTGDKDDSATMNVWLHKQVIKKLEENGGKVRPTSRIERNSPSPLCGGRVWAGHAASAGRAWRAVEEFQHLRPAMHVGLVLDELGRRRGGRAARAGSRRSWRRARSSSSRCGPRAAPPRPRRG